VLDWLYLGERGVHRCREPWRGAGERNRGPMTITLLFLIIALLLVGIAWLKDQRALHMAVFLLIVIHLLALLPVK
jgi:hypothetical protein